MRAYNQLKRRLMTRAPQPLRWDVRDDPTGLAPGCVIVADALRKEYVPKFPAPRVIGWDGTATFDQQVGTFAGYLAVITGATVAGQDGFIELSDGSFLVQPAWHRDNVVPNPVYWRRRMRPAKRVRGRWFSCMLYFCYGYYHWICDVLPRFHRVLERLPSDVRFLVPWQMEPWKWDALEAIGVARERCVRFPAGAHWRVDELYYAPPAAMTGDHDPEAMRWVNERVCHSLSPGTEPRIFISRRKAASRRLANEAELYPVLDAQGFRIVCAEDVPFRKQVAVFMGCRVALGVHGGGMTNMVWARPGARVIEILHPDETNRRCYWSLANSVGHVYGNCVASKGEKSEGGNSPITLEPKTMKRVIAAAHETW